MQKLNQHQFKQALSSLVKTPVDFGLANDFGDDFAQVVSEGWIVCPVPLDRVFVMPERLAIFTDVQKKRRSVLVQLLLDRDDETVLVVDSFLTGKDALHLATLVSDTSVIQDWVAKMHPASVSLTIKPIDEQYKIMVASLSSFVFTGDR